MSDSYKAEGTIYHIYETKQISDTFCKREFVLERPDGKYPQKVLFQVKGDRCSELDGYKTGDALVVEFNLNGREWTSPQGDLKFFNSLDVWRMTRTAEGQGDGDIPF